MVTDKATVKTIKTESRTDITGCQIDPYEAPAHDADLTVSIENVGNYRTAGIVTVTGCPSTVDPVPAHPLDA